MALNLRNQKVIICVGSGGVGKTTISAALGVLAAEQGLNALVMTIDPSQRLRQALGLNTGDFRVVPVGVSGASGKLSACVLNAEQIFYDFIQTSSTPELASKLLSNRLYKQLSTTLSGSQEFTSLLQLSRVVDEKSYDLIILDTPPAQHAIDFLEAPQKLSALFQENVVRWFVGDDGDLGLIQKVFYRGTRVVLGILEKITGSHFMSELYAFFVSIRSVQQKIANRSLAIQQLLQSAAAQFIVITAFDEVKLKEAEGLKEYLDGRGHHLLGLIVNRARPPWARPEDKRILADFEMWDNFYKSREKTYDTYANKWGLGLPVLRIPDFNSELTGVESLKAVAHELRREIH